MHNGRCLHRVARRTLPAAAALTLALVSTSALGVVPDAAASEGTSGGGGEMISPQLF